MAGVRFISLSRLEDGSVELQLVHLVPTHGQPTGRLDGSRWGCRVVAVQRSMESADRDRHAWRYSAPSGSCSTGPW